MDQEGEGDELVQDGELMWGILDRLARRARGDTWLARERCLEAEALVALNSPVHGFCTYHDLLIKVFVLHC